MTMSFKGGWLNDPKQALTAEELRLNYTIMLADDALILGQQLSKWCSNGPVLEQDIAIINTALDHIGRARLLYQYAAQLKGGGADEDNLAYLRDAHEFRNLLLLEQPNGHWGDSIARGFLIDTYNYFLFEKLCQSTDHQLSGIAQKALKEIAYHAQWSAEWVIRLGDGTDLSHQNIQNSFDQLWMWTGELFEANPIEEQAATLGFGVEASSIRKDWDAKVNEVLSLATLKRPDDQWMQTGGRKGVHTEHLGYILAEMQFLPRAYPDAKW
jgi:ring-1,2-phenylacetyl-CoA epoxidase subunit PaaC